MPRGAPSLPALPEPGHHAWSEVGRTLSLLKRADQARLAHELLRWPWRFRRAGGDPLGRPPPAWRLGADEPDLCAICRVYVGTAEDLDAATREPGFSKLFAPTIRVVEVLGRNVPSAGTLRAFRCAQAVIHRQGPLPVGPWPALEGLLAGPVPPGATRLALHGPVTASAMWELACRPIRALWLGNDAEAAVLDVLTGGNLQVSLRRLWTGPLPVEAVLAAGEWPQLERLGGPVIDFKALLNVLHRAPRLTTLDLHTFVAPPLAPLVQAGVGCIRLTVPFEPRSLLSTPSPPGLRWLGLAGFLKEDEEAELRQWGPRRLACEPDRPSGLAWLGF